jgi:ribonucleoside-triphosphate reductase
VSNISEHIQKGTTPLLTKITSNLQLGKIDAMINLVGINESIYNILGYKFGNESENIVCKVLQTAVDIIGEQTKESSNSSIGIAILKDESSNRFKSLDNEKYGKSIAISDNSSNDKQELYSQGFQIKGTDVLSNNLSLKSVCDHYCAVEKILKGNLSIDLDIENISSDEEVRTLIESSLDLPFVRMTFGLAICNICGKRSQCTNNRICEYCGSHKISLISI